MDKTSSTIKQDTKGTVLDENIYMFVNNNDRLYTLIERLNEISSRGFNFNCFEQPEKSSCVTESVDTKLYRLAENNSRFSLNLDTLYTLVQQFEQFI